MRQAAKASTPAQAPSRSLAGHPPSFRPLLRPRPQHGHSCRVRAPRGLFQASAHLHSLRALRALPVARVSPRAPQAASPSIQAASPSIQAASPSIRRAAARLGGWCATGPPRRAAPEQTLRVGAKAARGAAARGAAGARSAQRAGAGCSVRTFCCPSCGGRRAEARANQLSGAGDAPRRLVRSGSQGCSGPLSGRSMRTSGSKKKCLAFERSLLTRWD